MNLIKKWGLSQLLILLTGTCFAHDIDRQALLNNLAFGSVIELNQYSPGTEKGLILRLFATPAHVEECGLETSGTCKNQYLITAASYDEDPEVQAFVLQTQGEFLKADWLDNQGQAAKPDQAHLILTFRNYHRFATRANTKLRKELVRVDVKVSRTGIEETLMTKGSAVD